MRRRFLIAISLLLVTSFATVLPLCNAMFHCGCSILHGERSCNIHDRTGPHCPWCIFTLWLILKRTKPNLWLAAACSMAAYLAVMILAARVTARVLHYG